MSLVLRRGFVGVSSQTSFVSFGISRSGSVVSTKTKFKPNCDHARVNKRYVPPYTSSPQRTVSPGDKNESQNRLQQHQKRSKIRTPRPREAIQSCRAVGLDFVFAYSHGQSAGCGCAYVDCRKMGVITAPSRVRDCPHVLPMYQACSAIRTASSTCNVIDEIDSGNDILWCGCPLYTKATSNRRKAH